MPVIVDATTTVYTASDACIETVGDAVDVTAIETVTASVHCACGELSRRVRQTHTLNMLYFQHRCRVSL